MLICTLDENRKRTHISCMLRIKIFHFTDTKKACFCFFQGDGCCFVWSEKDEQDVCFTGPDCDSVYKVRANLREIYTASRDAKIRKYIL